MKILSKAALLKFLTLILSFQIIQCTYHPYLYSRTKRKVLIDKHLNQLEKDLTVNFKRSFLGIPTQDIETIKKLSKHELEQLTYKNLDDKTMVNDLLNSVLKKYITSTTKSIAKTLTNNENQINTIVNTISENLESDLKYCHRNDYILCHYFGYELKEEIQARILNPDYIRPDYCFYALEPGNPTGCDGCTYFSI